MIRYSFKQFFLLFFEEERGKKSHLRPPSFVIIAMFKALELVINQRQLMPIRIGSMMPILKVIDIRLADNMSPSVVKHNKNSYEDGFTQCVVS